MYMLTDINERKRVESALAKVQLARQKEIHHRIKNNLQIISSLLDLQSEQFKGKKSIRELEVLKAFRESQDRVASMALIHEELHKGEQPDTINFSDYIVKLSENLFKTYSVGNTGTKLITDVDHVYFDMDTAIPLGIVVNELVSNSLKYAFAGKSDGEINITLCRERESKCTIGNVDYSKFILKVSDNGAGIPESVDIENTETLGMQLVRSLVDQLDGELKVKRESGTSFIFRFSAPENDGE
jgi:two-component sensor histidine kinase